MPRIELQDTAIAWREAGTGDRVLLLVHGFPFDSRMWQPQLDAPPEGWRVLAPDLRGFGESGPVGSDHLSMEVAADDLAALLQHLGITSAVVGGLSMGGYVAFAMLRRHSRLLRGLVLADTRAEPDSDEARQARLEKAAAVKKDGTAALMEAMLPTLLSPFTMSRRPAVVEQVRAQLAAAPAEAVYAALRGLAGRADSTPLLRSIVTPTQVIAGADDRITPAGEARMMARAIPGARFDTIEDAGHLPNLEQPADFNSVLKSFLSSVQ